MTAKRVQIAESLAKRGRPDPWATEAEAAVLSGYTPSAFKKALPELEKLGFPRKNILNGKRSAAAILAFWKLPTNDPAAGPISEPDERELEKWDDGQGKRLAS